MVLKKIITAVACLLSLSLVAQTTDTSFQKEWAGIDTLIVKRDRTRTALDLVNILYQRAHERKLPAQVIKTLIYRYSLEDRISSFKEPNTSIRLLNTEIEQAKEETEKAILHALLAKLYDDYYQVHRWEIYSRKRTAGIEKNDIATWGSEDFERVILLHYFLSIRDGENLLKQDLAAYDAVIIKGTTKNRYTFFDLLAERALGYFLREDASVKPANMFILADEKALGSIADFIRMSLVVPDSMAKLPIALQIFQRLLAFHQGDADKNMLVKWDIERIRAVYNKSVIIRKETLRRQALEEITGKYSGNPSSAQAWYELAKIKTDHAAAYEPFGDTSSRYEYVSAEQMLIQAIPLYKDTNTGLAGMLNLLQEIRHKQLTVQTEKVNVPDKPFRALIEYRNTDKLYTRVIKMKDVEGMPSYPRAAYWKKIASLPFVRSSTQDLPAVSDHQKHSVEIKVDQLSPGEYVLLASDTENFDDSLGKLSSADFQVSSISYVRSGKDFFVLKRETGQPMNGVHVKVTTRHYDQRSRKFVNDSTGNYVTNNRGYFTYTFQPEVNSEANLLFTYKNDRLASGNETVYTRDNDDDDDPDEVVDFERRHRQMFFFTDRSIYRPGQTIFFKGIAVTKTFKTNLSKLITQSNTDWVYLEDANRKMIDSIPFTLNEYGSFSGQFHLPTNGLTGNFILMLKGYDEVNNSFNVEEYKRPTFSVSFDKVKGSYRFNDSVTISGSAKAYSGQPIDGAKVAFNVTRKSRYSPIWSRGRRFVNIPERQIVNGEISTDANGNFSIRFKASTEDIVNPTDNMLFDFAVSADITDKNGETRSSETLVNAGSRSLLLTIHAPSISDADSIRSIGISTTNLSLEKQAARVNVKVVSLSAPSHAYRKRYWSRPDQFVLRAEQFAVDFPSDEYAEETDFHTWPSDRVVVEGIVDTKSSDSFLVAGKLLPGYYQLEASSIDKDGQVVKTTSYIQVFGQLANRLAGPQIQFNYSDWNVVEPGQTVSFFSGTSAEKLFVIDRIKKRRADSVYYTYQERGAGVSKDRYTIQASDRGGFSIEEIFVYDNRVYTNLSQVFVPWTNKQLSVSYSTYRNKTEPGSKETWTVQVSGDHGQKVAAELLTGMYDASLDQFNSHSWQVPNLWPENDAAMSFSGAGNFGYGSNGENFLRSRFVNPIYLREPRLATNMSELYSKRSTAGSNLLFGSSSEDDMQEVVVGYSKKNLTAANVRIRGSSMGLAAAVPGVEVLSEQDKMAADTGDGVKKEVAVPTVIRTNFNETAFFFPQLQADSSGNYRFSFTMPDALTKWKWMSIAHTKDLSMGSNTEEIITQKKLMIQANAPRFMREGDNMEFSAKVSNLTDKEITGQVSLELFDATANTPVDGWFQNIFPSQYFTVGAGQSFAIKFPIQVPSNFNKPLTWRVMAKSGDMSDGEENTLPVLSNRMLVTETLPLLMQGDSTKHFSFDKLRKNASESITNESLTVEYTSNPVWSAVQALPYLIEYPYECAEQTFNRIYANTLASFIINKSPLIKKVFEEWKRDTASLQSNLQKNAELKQVLLEETPWILQAENESAQRNHIAKLFDMVNLRSQNDQFIEKLLQQQLPSGGFAWFKGGTEDRYITNYIVTGIGKLKRMGALTSDISIKLRTMLGNAMKYLDGNIETDYKYLLSSKADTTQQHVSATQIDYLYMRSFFGDIQQTAPAAWRYFYQQGKRFWVKENSFSKAQLGAVAIRNGDKNFALQQILPALLENAITDAKEGIYWKNQYTHSWYASPVEHQSMMISFMSEANNERSGDQLGKQLSAMKTWLLLHKQTNHWGTTIATADACYALLLTGGDWLSANRQVAIRLGNYLINSTDQPAQAGTGYFKKRIEGKMVQPSMGGITVTTSSNAAQQNAQPSWGSVYWQYFENMDKISYATSPLSVTKKLFIEKNTDKGKTLVAVKDGEELAIGDKIVIRMELSSDRDMDYLHLKDTRAAGMEPVNVLSGYKWQNGLGYYESTKDASSNFFISHIRKGVYIFEYPVYITHTGIFSAGITTIQCMYAPEFTGHSDGMMIRVR